MDHVTNINTKVGLLAPLQFQMSIFIINLSIKENKRGKLVRMIRNITSLVHLHVPL